MELKPIPDRHIGSGDTMCLSNCFRIKHFVMGICLTWVRRNLVATSRGVMNGNKGASYPPCNARYPFTGGKNADYPVTFILTLTWHYNSINKQSYRLIFGVLTLKKLPNSVFTYSNYLHVNFPDKKTVLYVLSLLFIYA